MLRKEIKNKFYGYKWYEVYDFIEFIVDNYPYESANQEFMNYCNSFLESCPDSGLDAMVTMINN